jgi:hypothetical protein
MMRGSASLHADQARRTLARKFNHLLASQLSGDDNVARAIYAVHLKYVLGEINADGANLHVDDPPPVIRCSTITPFGAFDARSGRRPLHQSRQETVALQSSVATI